MLGSHITVDLTGDEMKNQPQRSERITDDDRLINKHIQKVDNQDVWDECIS